MVANVVIVDVEAVIPVPIRVRHITISITGTSYLFSSVRITENLFQNFLCSMW